MFTLDDTREVGRVGCSTPDFSTAVALFSLLFTVPLVMATDFRSTNFISRDPVLDDFGGFSSVSGGTGAANGITQDIGHIDVGYRIQITALQEAGRSQSRLMYIATPTF